MRLMILWPDRQAACQIRDRMENEGWYVEMLSDSRSLLPWNGEFDVLLMHLCLPGADGLTAGQALADSRPVCPPRILFAAPSEWCVRRPSWADCMICTGADTAAICTLIRILAHKPLPAGAMAAQTAIRPMIERFLDDMSFPAKMKGRAYSAWLLGRMVPSTCHEDMLLSTLYADCARAFATTPGAVERCLRVAVENVFTQGNLHGIERFFGATVDPERGKPTNRAFLLQSAQQIRHSFTASRSPNSSVMHHSPAAPTSV